MTTYEPIIQELERELLNVTRLWQAVSLRQVRVTQHLPGAELVDITEDYADGLRKGSDALLKAVAALKTLPN
jgi:hypothetical protein